MHKFPKVSENNKQDTCLDINNCVNTNYNHVKGYKQY